jgi:hypothetical protein
MKQVFQNCLYFLRFSDSRRCVFPRLDMTYCSQIFANHIIYVTCHKIGHSVVYRYIFLQNFMSGELSQLNLYLGYGF